MHNIIKLKNKFKIIFNFITLKNRYIRSSQIIDIIPNPLFLFALPLPLPFVLFGFGTTCDSMDPTVS